jgi:hypothetical protein
VSPPATIPTRNKNCKIVLHVHSNQER